MSDLISREALCEYALNQKDKSITPNDIMRFPSAQPETHEKRTETHACDCISRQAAIDIERNATVDTNPSHFVAHQKFTQFLDDAEISSFGRWQWSNGFNTALTAVGIDLKKLPSAQPERAGRCVWCDGIEGRRLRIEFYWIDDDGNTASFSEPHIVATGIAKYCPECGRKLKMEVEHD